VVHATAGKEESFVGPIIQGKAKMLAKMMGDQYKSVTASSGWLGRWKTRYGVRHLNICAEKLSVDEGAVIMFKTKISDLFRRNL
jgi:hypothetical protein